MNTSTHAARPRPLGLLPGLVVAVALAASIAAQPAVFVRSGVAADVDARGDWSSAGASFDGRGALFAGREFGAGDARVAVTLRWTGGVVVAVGSGVLRVDGRGVSESGALFEGAELADLEQTPEDGARVSLTITRRGGVVIVALDEAVVAITSAVPAGPLGAVAVASAGEAALRVVDFVASGDVVPRVPRAPLWTNLRGGTEHRSPGLLTTPRGTLLAYCEARAPDARTSIVARRSTDGGRTWDASSTVASAPDADHAHPCAVASSVTDVLWLVTARDDALTQRVVTYYSADDGVTWEGPVDITAAAMRPEWRAVVPVTGAGVEVVRRVEGRLVVPAEHVTDTGRATHVMLSDEFGSSWELGGVGPSAEPGACAVVELDDGDLMLITRADARLLLATSDDDGRTWNEPVERPAVSPDTTRFSLARHSFGSEESGPGRVVVASLAHPDPPSSLGLFTTRDEGLTRSPRRELHAGPAGRSSVAILPDGSVAVVFEVGVTSSHDTIEFARLTIEDIEGR